MTGPPPGHRPKQPKERRDAEARVIANWPKRPVSTLSGRILPLDEYTKQAWARAIQDEVDDPSSSIEAHEA